MSEDQFEQALADVAAGRAPASEHLAGLSNLLPEQLARFALDWGALGAGARIALLQALARHERENLRLDFNAIYHLAMTDEDPAVRREAIEATVEDLSPALLDRLLELAVEDHEGEVRLAAVTALEPLARAAELGELPTEAATRLRQALLETGHRPGERVDVRAAALAALGYFSDAEAQRELRAAFGEEELQLQAIRGMGHSADEAWLETLLPELESRDDALRRAAAEAVGEIGSEDAVPALVDLVDDPALPVRLAAIAALGEIGGEEAREALVYALEDERPAVREAAEAAIENLDFFDDPLGA